jgi:large subunit ribosomal protein L30
MAQGTIHIKYVRSGIGFDYHTKVMIRSLGLTRLNQVVERQDTPQIRGQVAKIPHFVEIVDRKLAPAWHSTPEYTIHPPEPKPVSEPVKEAPEAGAEELQEVSVGAEPVGETHEAAEAAPPKGKKHAAKEHPEKPGGRKSETKAQKAAKQHAAPAAKGKAKTGRAEAPKHAAKAAKHGKSEKKGKK